MEVSELGDDAMYLEYWGFDRPPFNVGSAGAGYFRSPTQVEALARLSFLVDDQQRLGVLVGTSGIGKSILLDAFARRQRMLGHQVVHQNLLGMQHDEFVLGVADDLGEIPASGDTLSILWRRIEDRLTVNQYQQLPTVFLLDDADDAESDVLTAVVRLAQWKSASEARITIVVACHEDRVKLLGSRLIDLCELRIDLGVWEAADTAAFVREICTRAGRDEPVFDDSGLERLHHVAKGVPRRIRQVGELALLAGAAAELKSIDGQTIDDVVVELNVVDQPEAVY